MFGRDQDPAIGKSTRFTSNNQPKNRGARKRVLTKYRDEGYSVYDIQDTCRALLALQKDEIDDILKDEDSTMLELAIARTMQKVVSKGEFHRLKEILQIVYDSEKGGKSEGIDALIQELRAPGESEAPEPINHESDLDVNDFIEDAIVE